MVQMTFVRQVSTLVPMLPYVVCENCRDWTEGTQCLRYLKVMRADFDRKYGIILDIGSLNLHMVFYVLKRYWPSGVEQLTGHC